MMDIKQMGSEIRERRKFLGITQTDLAEIAGISVRSLKAVESGKGNPTIRQVIAILQTLGLELSFKMRQEQ